LVVETLTLVWSLSAELRPPLHRQQSPHCRGKAPLLSLPPVEDRPREGADRSRDEVGDEGRGSTGGGGGGGSSSRKGTGGEALRWSQLVSARRKFCEQLMVQEKRLEAMLGGLEREERRTFRRFCTCIFPPLRLFPEFLATHILPIAIKMTQRAVAPPVTRELHK
jgi:hypothetical protein